ncbi:HAD-IC family P-type ATPase [Actinomadura rudentiformis]|uniref:HAD-IC family P-type ATPase n=1 Tax=Actinomadura rudentiformis TaxID=359158 RepID=A0A6H9Z9B2_9ACTN|nr:HAD-IC family P-type ATPase [Actinomadura rudentiformis]KAB2352255.1 HAD-IC family P-type ATPase [Actinomadura rudentiformis]
MEIVTKPSGREILAPYQRTTAQVAADLGGDVKAGLSVPEAAARLERSGPNTLPAPRRRGPVVRFLLQFHSPLIYVLLLSAVITAVLGDHVDAAVILGVVIANAIVGFAQEARAEKALAALVAMTQISATVIRDGTARVIPSTDLVPGDLVVLEAGGKVPADLRVAHSDDLQIDESALTGESAPVSKDPEAVTAEAVLADRHNMAYSGTLVTHGTGTAIVTATGAATELGLIHHLVGQATAVQTPLTRKIARFSRLVTVAILGLAALTFLIGVLRGQPAAEMLTAAVALAVGAIPEGLPAVVTITLAFGVARMVRRNAIIRRLPAVETLGSTTVICTDKTGTLTENRMTVTTVATGGHLYDVTGTGYAPHGRLLLAGHPVDVGAHPGLGATLKAGLACNDAHIVPEGNEWKLVGDPTEGALVTSAAKAGIDSVPDRVETLPFASERQYMATLHQDGIVYVKGSVERVLALCDTQLDAGGASQPLDHPAVTELAEALGRQGLRVLAFASGEPAAPGAGLDALPSLTLLGLQAMHDPPRPAAADAVRACRTAGIQVKMITGDHAETAAAIGAQIGLSGEVMTGPDIAACPDEQLPDAVERAAVFARVSPEQKLRLVRALQSRSHVIAMTGDGVNDAPALKQADIGVAMGQAGTEVAKESADMVLTDDDFASIEAAVEEGRGVFDNLVKFIVWALPANIGLGLVLVAAIVIGGELPILPVQVLWLNMTAILVLGLPFALEPHDDDIMHRPPRDPALPLITRPLAARILLVSAILLTGAFGLFHWEQNQGASLAEARTIVVNVFAMTLLTYLFNCLSMHRPMLLRGIRRNPWVGAGALALIAIQLLYTYAPFMNDLFRSAPINAGAWARVTAVAVLAYALVELAKRLTRPSPHERKNYQPPSAFTL